MYRAPYAEALQFRCILCTMTIKWNEMIMSSQVPSPQIWDSSLSQVSSQVTRVHNSGKVPKQHRLVTFLKKLPQVSSHLQKMLYFFCFA